jgi:hypothetical protein
MYDEIRCEAPLPEGGRTAGVWFQTKSFPDPLMRRYVITHGGKLLDSVGHDLEPEGYVSFYTSDEGSGPTDPAVRKWREYRARFVAGQLQSIVRVKQEEAGPGRVEYELASFRWFDAPTFMFGEPEEE